MKLFKFDNLRTLEQIKEQPFQVEKEIQQLTEKNLNSIFGLSFICTEFALNNFRIDTLAYDQSSSSFVIIEYKRDKNFSVIDQGYAYLSLMLNNKADFILEYNENCKDPVKREDIDWTQSRVIFISPNYTTYQREAINFKDLPIELWEVKKYSNQTIIYNQIQASGSQESIKTISRSEDTIATVTKEIKVYSEQDHLDIASDEIKELYCKLKNAILNIDNLDVKPKKLYIAFVAITNVVDVKIQKNGLKLWLNMRSGQLDDPKGICRDVSHTGHWGNGNYEIQMQSDENIEYIMSLIKQSIRKNKKERNII